MMKALSSTPMLTPLTVILLVILVSSPETIVAPSGGAVGGGGRGVSGGSVSAGSASSAAILPSTAGSNQASGGNSGYGSTYGNYINFSSRKSIMILMILIGVLALFVICCCCCMCSSSRNAQRTAAQQNKVQRISVVKLQVALNGTAVSFQRDLNAIARKADTSKRSGYKYVLEESAKALLRHTDYWLSSYLSVDLRSNIQQATYVFNHYSHEERSKFDQETLTNIDDYKRERIGTGATTFTNPFILVTILLESTELLQLHQVNTTKDLEAVLHKFTTVSQNGIVACHVLWTPQEEDDCLTEKWLLQDYPNLRQLDKEVKLSIY